MIIGWYYLHTNGELIFKRELGGTAADIRESDFAVALWPMDQEDRMSCWRILVEGLSAGAKPERVSELATKWQCDDTDAQEYAKRIGANIFMDGSNWCATRKDFVDLQQSTAGFGPTALEAMADLCTKLGYRPSKMWGASFHDLLNRPSE